MPISIFTSVKELTSVTTVSGITLGSSVTAQVAPIPGLALALNFLNTTSLDTRITFSRGTNATLIDSTGLLTYAPSNQIPNSESFTATTWTGVGISGLSSVGSNVAVAPDGTTTADSIVEVTGGAASDHRINYSGLAGNAGKYAASVYLKAGTRTFARLQFDATLNAVSSSAAVQINLSDGTPSSTTVVGNITAATATSEDVGNGWYRLGLIFTISPVYVLSGGSVRIYLMQSLAATPSYIGNGSNIFVWGAQFGAMTYETAPHAYNSTTPKNLLGFTEEFDVTTSGWAKTNSTVTANAIADPNGYLNADKLLETAITATHYVQQVLNFVIGTVYTFSFYAKAAERSNVVAFLGVGAFSSVPQIMFNLTGSGSVTVTNGSPTGTITALANGWYRCSMTDTCTTSGAAPARILIDSGAAYLGVVTSGIYAWGAQISDSASLDPYVYNPAAALTSTAYYGPRFDYDPAFTYSTNNLIPPYANPQDFNTDWFRARTNVALTVATADPSGGLDAYKLTEDTTASNTHLIQINGSATAAVTAGTQYTYSIYVKAAERTVVNVSSGIDYGTYTVNGGNIDLLTGVVSGTTGTAPIVTNVGNGWWRISLTVTAITSTLGIVRLNLITGGAISYNGDGISGVYIWGAQLTASAAAVPFYYYSRTPNPLGLLIEEARTNLLLQSEQLDIAATWPSGNVDVTANTIASPSGATNADAIIEKNTPAAFHYINQSVTKSASSIQYAASFYVKNKGREVVLNIASSGSNGVAARVNPATGSITAGLTAFGTGWTAGSLTITSAGNSWYKVVAVATSDTATTVQFQCSLYNTALATNVYIGDGVSGTYLWGAQLETAGFATSYIPTVTASATRSADVATMVGNNFSNWYNQTEGTIVSKYDNFSTKNFPTVYGINDASASNRINSFCSTITTNRTSNVVGGTTQAEFAFSNYVVGTTATSAIALAANNFASSVNGATVQIDITGTMPVVTQIQLGVQASALDALCGHIKTVSYYNTRLPNTQLQVLTL